MNAPSLPVWVQLIQAVGLIALPIVGAWIALQQLHLAREKHRQEVFEKLFNRRMTGHNQWLSDLLKGVSDFGLRIYVGKPRRRNSPHFYKYVEADLIDFFIRMHGSLPLINRQREPKYAGRFEYRKAVEKSFRRVLCTGAGAKPHWALIPTPGNGMYDRYVDGMPKRPKWRLPSGHRSGVPWEKE